MKTITKLGLGGITAVMVLAPAAQAATSTATILVSATVLSLCTITAAPLAFGNYTAASLNATTTVSVTCTVGTPYNVGLDAGTGSGATTTVRKMTLNTGTLSYALYSDAARSVAWGNTVGSNTVAGTGNGLVQALTVYGQVPANQVVAPGAYLDTVTATITY